MKRTLRRLLLILCAGFLLAPSGFSQTRRARQEEEPPVPPIELSEITLEYAIPNLTKSGVVWVSPTAEEPNAVSAAAVRLRVTAKVLNRPAGSTIRIGVSLQEVCPSPDAGKSFIAKLRHLADTDSTNTAGDPAAAELQTIGPDGRVKIELPVHCHECARSSCGDSCDSRDHLGEGPHITTVTTSDPTTAQRARQGKRQVAAAAKASSFRLDIRTFCPEEDLRKRAK